MGCIVVVQMELQELNIAIMAGSCIMPPPPELAPPQIPSSTFKAEVVCLVLEQLNELKVLVAE